MNCSASNCLIFLIQFRPEGAPQPLRAERSPGTAGTFVVSEPPQIRSVILRLAGASTRCCPTGSQLSLFSQFGASAPQKARVLLRFAQR
jgi:hypothetical protein